MPYANWFTTTKFRATMAKEVQSSTLECFTMLCAFFGSYGMVNQCGNSCSGPPQVAFFITGSNTLSFTDAQGILEMLRAFVSQSVMVGHP